MAIVFANNTLRKLFGDQLSSISTLEIDITVRERHRLPVELTTKPIQGGAKVADNILLSGAEIDISGIMTDSLLEDLLTEEGGTWEGKLRILDQIRLSREPFSVVTSVGSYDNVFFSAPIAVDRSATTHGALFFSTTVRELLIIDSSSTETGRRAEVRAEDSGKTEQTTRSNSPAVDAGKVQPKPPSKSILKQAADFFEGF